MKGRSSGFELVTAPRPNATTNAEKMLCTAIERDPSNRANTRSVTLVRVVAILLKPSRADVAEIGRT